MVRKSRLTKGFSSVDGPIKVSVELVLGRSCLGQVIGEGVERKGGHTK